MARYVGAECRQCRREGMKLFIKGNKCTTDKCAFERRNTPPGQHTDLRSKVSDYGKQLREKQKLRRIYGVLERQFRGYYQAASRKSGVTGEILLQLLERRLDNVVFRMGFAVNRLASRQLVNHGHVTVNGHKVDIASFSVKVGDKVEIREKSRALETIKQAIETLPRRGGVPAWMTVSHESFSGVLSKVPSKEEMALPIQEQLIVELYSK
ncbi:MAG: 30S ribosomal protein S4 [Candidatus Firestonebacteria bacterium]|nr:30S ribosomal protein S4 [Candidatus Firestonebacteria bacterium]